MFAILISFAAAVSASVTPASDQTVEKVLSHCLGSFTANLPPSSDPAHIPPGLIEGTAVKVTPIAGDTQAFSYEGTNSRVMSCGVSIYGPVSPARAQKLTALVAGYAWKPHSIGVYDLSKQFPDAMEAYWGDPLAPSITGVAILTRKPNGQAPTVEIEYHSVMVR